MASPFVPVPPTGVPTVPAWPPADASNPFGLSVQDVHRLVPYRQLPSAPADAYPSGTLALSTQDIEAWIAQLSGDLMGRLTLAAGVFLADSVAWGQVYLMCRDAVSNGAASYWEAAFYPERAGVNDTTYAGVLWQRYLRSVEAIEKMIQTLLSQSDQGGDGLGTYPLEPPLFVPGAGYIWSLFPPVAIPDTIRW